MRGASTVLFRARVEHSLSHMRTSLDTHRSVGLSIRLLSLVALVEAFSS